MISYNSYSFDYSPHQIGTRNYLTYQGKVSQGHTVLNSFYRQQWLSTAKSWILRVILQLRTLSVPHFRIDLQKPYSISRKNPNPQEFNSLSMYDLL